MGVGFVIAGKIVASAFLKTVIGIAIDLAISFVISTALKKKPRGNLTLDAFDRKTMIKQSVVPRRVVYGRVRASGPILFEQNTDNNRVKHLVIAVASHEIDGFEELYFDDERLSWNPADGTVGGKYAELVEIWPHLGSDDQLADPRLSGQLIKWTSNHRLRGIAYLYVRLKYDAERLPQTPNISCILRGRKVFDPRTGRTRWSSNPALCIRDYLRDLRYGLQVDADELDEDAVIAAANICDEPVALTGGGSEKRYEAHGTFNLNRRRGEILEELLSSLAGQLIYSGGRFHVLAGAWRPPAASFDESDLRGEIRVQTKLARRDRFNSVKGLYVSEEDNWEPTDFPARSDSGYVAADQGEVIWQDLELPYTLSPSMAQRIARIRLERARQEITAVLPLKLRGLEVRAGDVIWVSNSRLGWSQKPFEVLEFALVAREAGVDLVVQETASAVFDWNSGLEFEHDPAPDTDLADPLKSSPPTGVTATSDGSTALIQSDGGVLPRIRLTWTEPVDTFVERYEIQYRRRDAIVDWSEAGSPAAPATEFYITGVSDEHPWDVRIRTRNNFGRRSAWVEIENITVSLFGPPFDIQPPTNFKIRTEPPVEGGDGTQTPTVFLTWVPPVHPSTGLPDVYIAGYEIEIQDQSESDPKPWVHFARPGAEAVEQRLFGLSDRRLYWIRLRAVNTRRARSFWVTLHNVRPDGKIKPPPRVEGLRLLEFTSTITVAWEPVEIPDLDYYEVRMDSGTWEDAVKVARTKTTEHTIPEELTRIRAGDPQLARNHSVLVKAVTTSGVASALNARITVANAKPNLSSAEPIYRVERGVIICRFNAAGADATRWRLHVSKVNGFVPAPGNVVAENNGLGPLVWAWDDSESWGNSVFCRLSAIDELSELIGDEIVATEQAAVVINPIRIFDVFTDDPSFTPIKEVIRFLGNNGRMTSPLLLQTAQLANLGSVQLSTGVLTATDVGSTARIDVAAHQLRVPGLGDVSYNDGSISGLAFDTVYYVVAVDPELAGGAPGYQAFQSRSLIANDPGVYYVGAIRTPTDGGADTVGGGGGSGGDINRPTAEIPA